MSSQGATGDSIVEQLEARGYSVAFADQTWKVHLGNGRRPVFETRSRDMLRSFAASAPKATVIRAQLHRSDGFSGSRFRG